MKIRGITKQTKLMDYQAEVVFDRSKFTAFVGGFGSAKSYTLISKVLATAQWRRSNGQRSVAGVFAPTHPLLRDVNILGFEVYLREHNIKYSLNLTAKVMVVPAFSLTIWFRSMHKPENIVGFEISDAYIDEFDIMLMSKQEIAWVKIMSRLRMYENGTFTVFTTPEGFRLTHKKFVLDKVGNLYQADTRWNKYIPRDYIESLIEQYDDQLIEQYLAGQFVNLIGGKAYYGFNRKFNLVSSRYKPTNRKPLLVGLDFNVNPMTATIGQEVAPNKIIVFDEFYLHNSNTPSMVESVTARYPKFNVEVYPDLSGNKRSTNAPIGWTDLNLLKTAGWKVIGNKRARIKDRLAITNNAFSKLWLIIQDNCTHLVRDLEQVALTDDGLIDGSDKTLTHISDALTYMAERRFYRAMVDSRNKK